jgi:hypothetical protein
MNIQIKILFVLFVVLFIFGCAKNESQNNFFVPPNTKPILEISENASGLWDVTGQTLFLRLYNNGSAEFEYQDNEKKRTTKSKSTKQINSLKQMKISELEFQKLIELLNSENFQRIQDNYARKCCCTDAFLSYKINIDSDKNQRKIALDNFCGIDDLINPQARNNPDFPKILSDLMILTNNIRWKYYSK